MADEVLIGGNESRAKIREPGMMILWMILTLGIYGLVWYYKVNRELRDYGRLKGDAELGESNPTMSILAATIGSLIIVPPFVSYYNCTKRIQKADALAGEEALNGWLIFALVVAGFLTGIAWIAIPPVVQDNLNKIWREFPHVDDAAAGSTTAAAGEPKLEDLARED